MCFMRFNMFRDKTFYIFNECCSKFGFDLFQVQNFFEYLFGDQIFFSCFTRIFHPRVHPFLQMITYSIIKISYTSRKIMFLHNMMGPTHSYKVKIKPHLMHNSFLKNVSPAVSISINSWGQPSVIIVFTFDKIYDGNNVGITIENIH